MISSRIPSPMSGPVPAPIKSSTASPVDGRAPAVAPTVDVAAAMRGIRAAGSLQVEPAWSRPCRVPATHGLVAAGPGICGDRLGGGVFSLHAETGEPSWAVETRPLAGGVRTDGDKIFALEDKGTLRALDAASGVPRWTASLDGTFHQAPAVGRDGSLLALSSEGRLSRLDPRDGSVQWTRDLGRDAVKCGPVGAPDGTVYYAGYDLRLHALEPSTGEERWSHEMRASISSVAVDAHGNAYCARDYGRICAFDPGGGVRWDVLPAIGHRATDYRAPMLACGDDGRIYGGADKGWVFCLEPAQGGLAWARSVGTEARTAPRVAGETLYWGGLGGRVTAVDSDCGWHAWKMETGSDFASVPAVLPDGRVCVSDADGTVHHLDIEGARRRRAATAAQSPPPAAGKVEMEAETVVIGGIRIPRRR